jgi:hypothetical protein
MTRTNKISVKIAAQIRTKRAMPRKFDYSTPPPMSPSQDAAASAAAALDPLAAVSGLPPAKIRPPTDATLFTKQNIIDTAALLDPEFRCSRILPSLGFTKSHAGLTQPRLAYLMDEIGIAKQTHLIVHSLITPRRSRPLLHSAPTVCCMCKK